MRFGRSVIGEESFDLGDGVDDCGVSAVEDVFEVCYCETLLAHDDEDGHVSCIGD